MKIGTKYLFVVVVLTILSAFITKKTNDIKKAEWLIGTWENKTPRGSIYETWSIESDIEFSGMSYIIKEKDTVVFENIRLVQEQAGLFYTPIVKNQNDGLPIRFASKTISETQLVFENQQHDFPQIISYTRITLDSIMVEISGIKAGEERKQTFPMKRVK
jgi:hypothetical protein